MRLEGQKNKTLWKLQEQGNQQNGRCRPAGVSGDCSPCFLLPQHATHRWVECSFSSPGSSNRVPSLRLLLQESQSKFHINPSFPKSLIIFSTPPGPFPRLQLSGDLPLCFPTSYLLHLIIITRAGLTAITLCTNPLIPAIAPLPFTQVCRRFLSSKVIHICASFFSVKVAMAMKVVLLLVVLAVVQAVQAAEYSVKWEFPKGDSFFKSTQLRTYYVGDTLVFNYYEGMHNVVKVETFEEFDKCTMTKPLMPEYGNGQTKMTLDKPGPHYYICSIPGHCTDGMKIKVLVKHHHHND